MASDASNTSDGDEGFKTLVCDGHSASIKETIIQCISDSNDISVELHHEQGKPAKLFVALDPALKTGRLPQKPDKSPSKNLLVKNLPEAADEELLEMFFEHTKRQGGGPVKHVTLNKSDKMAIIEFENADSVTKVLDKQPIKIQGTQVDVEAYTPYLESTETIESIHLYGNLEALAKELATMKLKGPKNSGPIRRFEIPAHVECDGCGLNPIPFQIFQCRSCDEFYYCKPCLNSTYHLSGHVFTDISPGNDPLRSVHQTFRCNGCKKHL